MAEHEVKSWASFLSKNGQQAIFAVVKSDTSFYGQSPPVYPSPEMSGIGGWDEALSKAQAMVSQMSLEEKVNITGGYGSKTTGCSGNVPAIDRVGFPGMCVQDGPAGARGAEGVSGYPAGVHVGASWNKSLAYDRAYAMAGEFKRAGATLSLGPAVLGPLGRIARGERNWEGFGADPYLSGILVVQSVEGTQDGGVVSCTKHFIANEQEEYPFKKRDPVTNHSIEPSSSNIDDKTMHEVYMWPFADAVHAGTAMCSYQRVNNSYACKNRKVMNGLLKTELGFQGFVMSDFKGQKTGMASARAGMDMTMPLATPYWGPHVLEAVRNGSVPESNQDDSSVPLVGLGLPPDLHSPHAMIDARNPDDADTLLQGTIEGHVLVKSIDKALPLTKPRMLAVYGYDAKMPERNNPSNGFNDWTLGFYPLQTLETRARQDATQLFWDVVIPNANSTVPGAADACLVFINTFSSEGVDRPMPKHHRSHPQCPGIRVVDQWIDNPNVTSVIIAHLPGQDSGAAITKILPLRRLRLRALLAPQDLGNWDKYFPQDNFTEGVFIDYRAFDENNITSRFEFGFGLTYTTFNYTNLKISNTIDPSTLSPFPTGPIIPGGHADLWDTVATVTADVTNTGDVPAAEVGQLYMSIPGEGQPVRQLRGFDKVMLGPGETRTFEFGLRRRDLNIWDVGVQGWKLLTGEEYGVVVGESLRMLGLNGALVL
ncbi:uncharacterized protein ASPGLDRAFT_73965 [Aspergillus glaucus CBS 516.65]|uniref:Probable beta-glucosidase M n=1 Tax=Aspergillus glaucus CBS 516.65 TaxID=1160497 RepID=A0A1L9VN46_ASPGL|nr:hypothetical protein ASPGLDRAFT_73965 [Aspergillus glaucus CBS 516.65]OJJ85358.1 hypothetical protein ASPGLDRAFT_73965 [Aspergillus glaucus CBS 516.65]